MIDIVVGKTYKTRAGNKVQCVFEADPETRDDRFLVVDYRTNTFWYYPNGMYTFWMEQECDIVGEWPELTQAKENGCECILCRPRRT